MEKESTIVTTSTIGVLGHLIHHRHTQNVLDSRAGVPWVENQRAILAPL